MNTRIREVRKSLGMTMEKFGERIGVAKSTISNIESGKRTATNHMILSICREFNVNEEWLRTGKGKMKTDKNDDEIREWIYGMNGISDDFKKRFSDLLIKLPEEGWEYLLQFIETMMNERENESDS